MLKRFLVFTIIVFSIQSCTTMRDLKLLQKNENTVINQYGLIEHSYEPYRLQIDDYVNIVVETNDPDAKEFFSSKNLNIVTGSSTGVKNGLKIESDGYVHMLGLGSIYLEGLTSEQASVKVQQLLDEVYKPNMAIARVYVENLNFTVLGEVNGPGPKRTDESTINLIEALAICGDFTKFANRKDVHIFRQYPEGIKRVDLDFTQEDLINSPYFYLHPNDIIYVDPIPEKIVGLGGQSFWEDFIQFVSVFAYLIGTYAIIRKL